MKSLNILVLLLSYLNLNYCFNSLSYINNPKNLIKIKNKAQFYKPKYKKNINITMNADNLYQVPDNNGDTFVPDMQRRTIMNLILLGYASVPVLWLVGGFLYFLVPPSTGNSGGGVVAKDAKGDDVFESKWVEAVPYPSRSLIQGLRGDAHYLIVKEDNTLEKYAINAVCTHLGCVVPWNKAQNKYMCPCHGSQYDPTGKVIRGPAPQSLALANVNVVDDKVLLTEWTETDFRTDSPPWWIK